MRLENSHNPTLSLCLAAKASTRNTALSWESAVLNIP